MHIPMLDLVAQYNSIKDEIDQAMAEVLNSGNYIMGPQVKQFEDNMAEFLGVKHALGVASGSDALLLSLHALGIGPGDKVIVPTFTFFATASAVSRLGAIPVFADIDPQNYNLDLNQIETLLKQYKPVKAIIPVHIFGLPLDMSQLMPLAQKHNLYIIEDACQAINADINFQEKIRLNQANQLKSGSIKKAGTIGHTGCFSFFPSKNLGCFGDGGLITTNDDDLAQKLKILRLHGSSPKYYHSIIGYNSRLDTLQAAILNVKLNYLQEWTDKRRQVATRYDRAFQEAELNEQIKWPELIEGHVYHQYVIETAHRNELQKHLKSQEIDTAIYYPLPLHLQKCFAELSYQAGDLPVAEKACTRVLALPIDPELNLEQIYYIVESIKEFIDS